MSQSFQEQFRTVILPKLQKELKKKNSMAVPRFEKILVNIGIGTRYTRNKDFSDVMDNISVITGQKGSVRNSKKAISNFKLRANIPNGVTVTLRGARMYAFLSRFIHVAMPRMRDFQGLSRNSFDGRGNYSLGLRDISVFPEVKQDDLAHIHGVEITIVTSAQNDDEARALLQACNFPFRRPIQQKASSEPAQST